MSFPSLFDNHSFHLLSIINNCEIPDGEEFDSVRRGVKEKVDTKQTSAIQLANSILNNNKKYADFHMSYRDADSFF